MIAKTITPDKNMSHQTFSVGVWITQAQYNENGYEVRNTVENYLEAAESGDSNVYIYGYRKDGVFSPPTECPGESFTTSYPCDRTFDVTYDNLLPWWDDYSRCENLSTESDSNLLVTDCDKYCGGGRAYVHGTTCFANGNNIENLPNTHTDYDSGCGSYSMATALQEVGHNLMDGPSDSDGDGEGQHDTGETVYHSGSYAVTPMSAGYWSDLEGDNECGEWNANPDDLYEFNYANCAMSYFTEK